MEVIPAIVDTICILQLYTIYKWDNHPKPYYQSYLFIEGSLEV